MLFYYSHVHEKEELRQKFFHLKHKSREEEDAILAALGPGESRPREEPASTLVKKGKSFFFSSSSGYVKAAAARTAHQPHSYLSDPKDPLENLKKLVYHTINKLPCQPASQPAGHRRQKDKSQLVSK